MAVVWREVCLLRYFPDAVLVRPSQLSCSGSPAWVHLGVSSPPTSHSSHPLCVPNRTVGRCSGCARVLPSILTVLPVLPQLTSFLSLPIPGCKASIDFLSCTILGFNKLNYFRNTSCLIITRKLFLWKTRKAAVVMLGTVVQAGLRRLCPALGSITALSFPLSPYFYPSHTALPCLAYPWQMILLKGNSKLWLCSLLGPS